MRSSRIASRAQKQLNELDAPATVDESEETDESEEMKESEKIDDPEDMNESEKINELEEINELEYMDIDHTPKKASDFKCSWSVISLTLEIKKKHPPPPPFCHSPSPVTSTTHYWQCLITHLKALLNNNVVISVPMLCCPLSPLATSSKYKHVIPSCLLVLQVMRMSMHTPSFSLAPCLANDKHAIPLLSSAPHLTNDECASPLLPPCTLFHK
ncbi:hypothetical protein BDQ17DRAFT_1427796 [Cyathus striatus]|nr:hypothetical protein BDQ17DRAFT_1427796 [Cyathus striatus]